MYQEAAIINGEDLFGSYSDQNASLNKAANAEASWAWPEEVGHGEMTCISPRPGIILETGNFRVHENIALRIKQTHHSVVFGFGLSGGIRQTVDYGKGQNDFWCHKTGQSLMSYIPECQQNIIRPLAGEQISYVSVMIDRILLKTFLGAQYNQMPIGLRNIMDGTGEQRFYQMSIIPAAINTIIHQIINCPFRSPLKKMFLEAKALELITYSLAQYTTSENALQNIDELRPDDIERIVKAKNILIRDLENPPSLLALARQVGTNKTTLNKGFQQIFGTSVFDYLRLSRLERAKKLLDNKKMNIGETALHVGYTHQSSFTRAYKKHFGTIPRDKF